MKPSRLNLRAAAALVSVLLAAVVASRALAELPAAETLLGDLGYSAAEIATVRSGKIAEASAKAATERDLAAAFAFHVKASPAELVKVLRGGLLNEVDPNTIKAGVLTGDGSVADLAGLVLDPDSASRVKRYLQAAGGDDLNLSSEEIAAFQALGSSAAKADVEAAVRKALLTRFQAYKAKGLAGIAPYDRGKGHHRDVAADLRAVIQQMTGVKKYAPSYFQLLGQYPTGKPEGVEEVFRWMHFEAHGIPTIALVHGMVVPDGDAFLALQRQYYVSEGFNCEQAVAAFLPVQDGTVVVYVNHTSTDQVEGFGGGAKRSIGSKLLASQLEAIFSKVQSEAPK
jgi:hypothetical protein